MSRDLSAYFPGLTLGSDTHQVGPRAPVFRFDVHENIEPGLLSLIERKFESCVFTVAAFNLNVYEPAVLGLPPGVSRVIDSRLSHSRIGASKILPRRSGPIRYDECLTVILRSRSDDRNRQIPRFKRRHHPPLGGALSQFITVGTRPNCNGSPANDTADVPF